MNAIDIMEVDMLQVYMGEDYIINDKIKIFQPTMGQIVKYGEKEYYSMVHTLCSIPSDLKSQLFDMGIDYESISDFQLFMILSPTMGVDRTEILFGDLDFSELRPFQNPQNDQIVLANKETGVIIDELIYERIVNYLRKVHGLKKKVEHAANEFTKRFLIDEDRQKIAFNKTQPYQSFLLPIISAVKARQGYSLDYVKSMRLFEFMDEVNRLQVIHNADHLLSGMYSGMMDTSKINKNDLNWMKEFDKD